MEGGARRQPGKPYAWVALVMGLDLSYVGAALVLASSLKRRSSAAEVVVMVTPDVPQSARGVLGRVADAVVEVPYLETLALQKYSERFDKMYNYWLDKCFTKFAMFGLTEYKKVAFLDADMLAVEDPDALFDCPAPAGICSSVREVRENERMHGQKLPRTIVEESLKNGQGRYGVRGCLLVMEPCEATLARIRAKVEAREHYGSVESMVGPDELLITRYFINEWSHIHAKYGWVSWADREELGVAPVFLHYVSQKPWDEGEDWDDFEYWKREAREVVKEVPGSLGYFGRLMDEIGSQAGVEVTDEMRKQAREIKESANLAKAKAKAMRENRASRLNIDLTSNTPRVTPRSARITTGRQVPPLSPSSRLSPGPGGLSSMQKANGQSAGRWRNQSPTAVTRSAAVPEVAQKSDVSETEVKPAPPLQSKSGGKVTKASANILVVDGFKRPYPSKPRPDKAPGTPGAPATSKESSATASAARPSTVPKLNLAIVKTDPKAPPAKKSAEGSDHGGDGDPGTWQGMHWHKKRGNELPNSVRSAADEMDSWRHGGPAQVQAAGPLSARPWMGGQETRLAVTPPATARPYIGVQESGDPASPHGSAGPWVAGQETRPPTTPPGSARVVQRSARYERWDAPRSSRADMASNWRSTPRGSSGEQGQDRSESPARGWGGRTLGSGDPGAPPYSSRPASTTQAPSGETPVLQQGARALNRKFMSAGNLDVPPGMLGMDRSTFHSSSLEAVRSAGLSMDAAAVRGSLQNGASENIIALLGKQGTDGWANRMLSLEQQQRQQQQQQQQQRRGMVGGGVAPVGGDVLGMGNGLGLGSMPLSASQPMYGHSLVHPNYSGAHGYGMLGDSALRLESVLASGAHRNGMEDAMFGQDGGQQWWCGPQQRTQGEGKLGGRGFGGLEHDALLQVAQLNLSGGDAGRGGGRGARPGTWGQGPEVARSGAGGTYYWS
ncbi:unnamed protein product [Ostreobium quekettii]|uniref:Nucleotide-diphospho-sugar transferase n=1 Tax=Ostreobium quekettii TaxID=121088 RepID=A0A8S1JCY2_9CHLO|nr:unnamed protein product [Ostreobium quekettii]